MGRAPAAGSSGAPCTAEAIRLCAATALAVVINVWCWLLCCLKAAQLCMCARIGCLSVQVCASVTEKARVRALLGVNVQRGRL